VSILPFGHKGNFLIQGLLIPSELFSPLQHFLVHSPLELVELGYFLLVDCNYRLHLLDSALVLDLVVGQRLAELGYFVILQLNVSGFLCIFSLKEEIMVFDLFEHVCDGSFDFVDFDGVFGLFLVEGLEQFTHNLSDLGLYLVPFEFSDFQPLFLALLFLSAHYLLRRKLVIIENKMVHLIKAMRTLPNFYAFK
jgi:hypothetical protein